jgi:hypothetical protein
MDVNVCCPAHNGCMWSLAGLEAVRPLIEVVLDIPNAKTDTVKIITADNAGGKRHSGDRMPLVFMSGVKRKRRYAKDMAIAIKHPATLDIKINPVSQVESLDRAIDQWKDLKKEQYVA